MKGRVKWFDGRKGYGFITSDDGEDIYVHFTSLLIEGFRTLKHNQRVEFKVKHDSSGRVEACDVQILR